MIRKNLEKDQDKVLASSIDILFFMCRHFSKEIPALKQIRSDLISYLNTSKINY